MRAEIEDGMDKVERDGKVAVLVSPGYGAGWSTWAPDGERKQWMLFAPVWVEWVEAGKPGGEKRAKAIARERWGDDAPYVGGEDDLEIQWLPKGTMFQVTEYDGSECLETQYGTDWSVA